MNNQSMLSTYTTSYSHTQQASYPIFIKVIRLPLIPIVYLMFKDKIDEYKSQIKDLKKGAELKTLTIKSLQKQIKDIRQQNNKPELIAEQTKRLVKNGNNVRLEETKTCDGDYRLLNEFMSSGGW